MKISIIIRIHNFALQQPMTWRKTGGKEHTKAQDY